MSSSIAGITLSQSLLKGLACAALNPGLRAILVFDAPYDALTAMASALAQLLRTTTGKEVRSVQLGTSELDDDLWGRFAISTNESGNQAVRWHQGLLTASLDDPSLSLIVIPGLTRLSLAATRACVMTVGADIVDLERNGQQIQWRPEICWLATCPTAQVGALSPHLLDRFSLRLHWEDTGAGLAARDAHWLQQILKDTPYVEASDYMLPPGLIEQVQRAAQQYPMLAEEARDSALAHISMYGPASMRREIALARLASAVAQLDYASTITIDHVTAAAEIIGLRAIRRSIEEPPPLEDVQAQPSQLKKPNVPPFEQPQLPIESRPSSPPSEAILYQATEQVHESDQPVEQHAILLPIQPYPEDTAPVEREVASLQLPLFALLRDSL